MCPPPPPPDELRPLPEPDTALPEPVLPLPDELGPMLLLVLAELPPPPPPVVAAKLGPTITSAPAAMMSVVRIAVLLSRSAIRSATVCVCMVNKY
jgi:hypothetical protein